MEGEFKVHQKALLASLVEWPSTLDGQSDLPPELLQGFKDIDEGRVVDLDKALTRAPSEI